MCWKFPEHHPEPLAFQLSAVDVVQFKLKLTTAMMNLEKSKSPNEQVLKELLQLKFVAQTLLQWKPNRSQVPDEFESIERALKVLSSIQFINLVENENISLLDLGNYCQKVTLSYSAQKFVRDQLLENLRKRLAPISRLIEKLQLDLPHLFKSTKDTEKSVSGSCQELLQLDSQRRKLLLKLGELKNQKMNLIKDAIDLKLGPQVKNELETLYDQARLNQTKANLMRNCFINELTRQSEHGLKAIKEVEGYIDKQLNEKSNEEI